ncbi:uncharacterized protein EHS24_004682 [Apiotrichum porosum]|uniref:Uncharacterized protein n=1 Tax=Apiotrichum porosum TaxID=105984 RepID=A0A427Y5S5_9TREE|nr:uncharacterized protein EHS24_004682 [Apiotrichum porosum]RSH86428.1 hypothetical protein EHS24_004682 [Apiotrichum porosum]
MAPFIPIPSSPRPLPTIPTSNFGAGPLPSLPSWVVGADRPLPPPPLPPRRTRQSRPIQPPPVPAPSPRASTITSTQVSEVTPSPSNRRVPPPPTIPTLPGGWPAQPKSQSPPKVEPQPQPTITPQADPKRKWFATQSDRPMPGSYDFIRNECLKDMLEHAPLPTMKAVLADINSRPAPSRR